MAEQSIIEQWFQESKHEGALLSFIQNLKESVLGFYQNRLHEHQELVNSITKQKIEGKTIDEKTSIKYYFILGELQEFQRLEGVVDGFIETLTHYAKEIKTRSIEAYANFQSNDPAFEFNSFFISDIMDEYEKEYKRVIHRLKEQNKAYADEQLPISVSFLKNGLAKKKSKA